MRGFLQRITRSCWSHLRAAPLLSSLYISWKCGDVLFVYRKLTFIYTNIYILKREREPHGACRASVRAVCRDVSAYRVFPLTHSRLYRALSFLPLCVFIFTWYFSLAMRKRKKCVRTKLCFYTLLFDLIYLFCQRNTKEKKGRKREKGREKRKVCPEGAGQTCHLTEA